MVGIEQSAVLDEWAAPEAAKPTPNRRLREIRKSMGLTQQQMADLIGVHKRTYEGWERGEITDPAESNLAGLYRVTGFRRREDLGFPSLDARPLGPIPVQPLPTPAEVIAAAAEAMNGTTPAQTAWLTEPAPASGQRPVDDADLYRIRRRTRIIGAMEEEFGGGAIPAETIIATLRASAALLAGRDGNRSTRQQMRLAVAEFALAAGSVLIDQQDYPTAQAVLLRGLAAAPTGRSARPQAHAIRYRLLGVLALGSIYARDRNTAEHLLALADEHTKNTPPTADVTALLLALKATVAAMADHVDHTHELITAARAHWAQAREHAVPAEQFTHVIAWALGTIELCNGRTGEDYATDAAEAAIAACEPHHHRTRTLNQAAHMMCLLSRGDYDHAHAAATALLPQARMLHSPRIRETIAMTHLVPRVVGGDPATAPIIDLLLDYDPPILEAVPETAAVAAAVRQRRGNQAGS